MGNFFNLYGMKVIYSSAFINFQRRRYSRDDCSDAEKVIVRSWRDLFEYVHPKKCAYISKGSDRVGLKWLTKNKINHLLFYFDLHFDVLEHLQSSSSCSIFERGQHTLHRCAEEIISESIMHQAGRI